MDMPQDVPKEECGRLTRRRTFPKRNEEDGYSIGWKFRGTDAPWGGSAVGWKRPRRKQEDRYARGR